MNYKKGIAFLMISTTVLGATGMHTISSFAEETIGETNNLMETSVSMTLDPYEVGKSSTITGSYDGTNGVFIRAEVNGEKKGLVSSKDLAQGKISYYIGKDLKAGDNVEVVIFDKNYQEIGRQKVQISVESVEQVFYIKGISTYGVENKLLIKVKDHKINIKENYYSGRSARMHSGYGSSVYFSLNASNPKGESIVKKEWKGNDLVSVKDLGTYDVPEGSTVKMYHAEGNGHRFSTNNDAELKSKTGKTYTYKMEDNRLVLVSAS